MIDDSNTGLLNIAFFFFPRRSMKWVHSSNLLPLLMAVGFVGGSDFISRIYYTFGYTNSDSQQLLSQQNLTELFQSVLDGKYLSKAALGQNSSRTAETSDKVRCLWWF